MRTVILCGGMGIRLRPETDVRPKPMLMVGERPILWHIMNGFARYGHEEFVLCLGYKGDQIRDYFFNYHRRNSTATVNLKDGSVDISGDDAPIDWRVTLAETGQSTLTGLRIKQVLPLIDGDRFYATYGDAVANVDLKALAEHHERSGRLATVTAVRPQSRFGSMMLDGDKVDDFLEKPQIDDGWVNGGYFVFERKAFDKLLDSDDVPLESGLLHELAVAGELGVYKHHGFWQCMDTYREYELLNQMWSDGDRRWERPESGADA